MPAKNPRINISVDQPLYGLIQGLTEDQRQSALSSFARLGTERLRPVFEDLNGAIPYEELKLLRLHHLCRDQ
jgi:hypothetical protein